MRRAILIAGAVCVASACGASTPAAPPATDPPRHQITGTLRLTASGLVHGKDNTCTPTGGYSDLHSGTQVLVKDGASKVIAQGRLEEGHQGDGKNANVICVFSFTVPEVPDADFYLVSVSHRGDVSHTRAEMDAANWNVELSLS